MHSHIRLHPQAFRHVNSWNVYGLEVRRPLPRLQLHHLGSRSQSNTSTATAISTEAIASEGTSPASVQLSWTRQASLPTAEKSDGTKVLTIDTVGQEAEGRAPQKSRERRGLQSGNGLGFRIRYKKGQILGTKEGEEGQDGDSLSDRPRFTTNIPSFGKQNGPVTSADTGPLLSSSGQIHSEQSAVYKSSALGNDNDRAPSDLSEPRPGMNGRERKPQKRRLSRKQQRNRSNNSERLALAWEMRNDAARERERKVKLENISAQNLAGDGKTPENETFDVLQGISDSLESVGQQSDSNQHGSPDAGDVPDWNDLPLSPLMHPRLIKARKRYHETKLLPSKDPSEFEALVARNPYAQMLATPVRVCRVTSSRLPSAFLTKFTLLRHPETRKLWQLPDSYHPTRQELAFVDKPVSSSPSTTSRELSTAAPDDTVADLDHVDSRTQIANRSDASQTSSQDVEEVLSDGNTGKSHTNHRNMSGCYILATRSAMDFTLNVPLKKRGNLYPSRWRERFERELTNNVHWRPDMSPFICKLMQNKVKRQLVYLAKLEKAYVTGLSVDKMVQMLKGLTQSKNPFKPGMAVLWIGSEDVVNEAGFRGFLRSLTQDDCCTMQTLEPALSYAVLQDQQGQVMPTFNLRQLLGKEGTEWLRRCDSEFDHPATHIRGKERTAEVVAWLWRLVGYGSSEQQEQQDSALDEGYPRSKSDSEAFHAVETTHASVVEAKS